MYFLGQLVSGKWQNVKDSFIKSLKNKSGQATSKKYIYHDDHQFLMKIVQKDGTVSSMGDSQQLLDSEDEKQPETDVEVHSQNTSKETYNQRKKSRLQQDIDREVLKALSSSNTAPDEDETFFISVPAVRRMSEEEKLDFRMSVLQLIKYISSRRKERTVFQTTFSSAGTSKSRTTTPLTSLSAIMDANQVNQLPHL